MLLVVIDRATGEYRRYVDKKCVLRVTTPRPLTREEVEQFRIDPKNMLDEPEPEVA